MHILPYLGKQAACRVLNPPISLLSTRISAICLAVYLIVSSIQLPWAHSTTSTASALHYFPQQRSSRTEYNWPLRPYPNIVRNFYLGTHRWNPGHRGLDLSAQPGQIVYASGKGVVLTSSIIAGRGVISIMHTQGLRTTYEPVSFRVRPGDYVDQSTPIGIVTAGHPDCPTHACLHWGLRSGSGHQSRYFNPLTLLGLAPVILKPAQPKP